MKKVAIIGAKGFIGRHIEWYLNIMGGFDIRLYDCVESDEVNYCRVDLVDVQSVSKIDVNVDYVFMFAGLTGTYAGFDAYEKYISVNEIGLLNLLDRIRQSEYRPRVVFPSSRLVYKGVDSALAEDAEKESKTIYAVNKLACEGYLKAFADSFDIPYTVFRICVPYGNMIDGDYSFGTIGFFLKMAQQGRNITLYGGGYAKRTFTHIYDLCNQMVQVILSPRSVNDIFNIGGETMSLRDAAEIVANKYGVKVVDSPWPERDLRIESGSTFFDDTKITTLLGGYIYKSLRYF